MSPYPQISIKNGLADAISIYDAFDSNTADKSLANFFGVLTSLGTVNADADGGFAPIHGPISTYIIYDSHNNPVKRVFTTGTAPQSFDVGQSDLDVIAATQSFVQLLQNKPSDPQVQQFNALLKGRTGSPQAINTYFKNSSDYKTCTYISYMLVAVSLARTPATRNLPPQKQSYSLSSLLKFMGIDWPSGLPDIVLTGFYCSQANDLVRLGGELNVKDITFADGVLDHVLSILPSETLRFSLMIDLEPGLAFGSIQLQAVFDSLSIPIGGGKKIQFQKPTVLLSITPLFKFIVFEIKAAIPFSLFGSPTFQALVAMTIDNAEAEIGVTLDGNGHTLLTPPGIEGLHFDQFGVGMGLFFKPPGFVLGVQGKFHIGDGGQIVQLDDDTFALVCEFEEEVPNPLFLSFYVPKLSLTQVAAIFTNKSIDINFPVDFSGLSFRWAENPMEPIVLPDGTLAPMGYGFSADMNLFGLGFYANVEIDLNNGVQGQADLDPLSFGPILSLTGDGKGVSIKVDANGNPIANNTIPQTAAAKQAIEQAKTKQVIRPGGAELHISTSASPYFKLDARLVFLEFHDRIDASIDSGGIHFALDFGNIISGKMVCVLQDYHNFRGTFAYGPNYSIPLPTIGGLSLGHIHLTAQIDVTLQLSTSTSNIVFTAAGGFNFEGLGRQIGPFNLDIRTSRLADVLSTIEKWLASNVGKVFGSLITDAGQWARAVYGGAIQPAAQGVQYVVSVLKNSFGRKVADIGELLKGSAYLPSDVAKALKSTFGADAHDVAQALTTAYRATPQVVGEALQAASYPADQIAGALRTVFNFSAEAAAQTLKGLKLGANEIAGALSSAYGANSQIVATTLREIGYGADDTTRALDTVFHIAPDVAHQILQGAGYTGDQIKGAFQSLGGDFANFGESTWNKISGFFGGL